VKLVIQRVKKAEVKVVKTGTIPGKIGEGLMVLFGVGSDDTREDAEKLAEKLVKMRIMADSQDKMNLSIKDKGKSILVISQFTLYADTSQGNRPSFISAAKPEVAKKLYDYFVELLRRENIKVETGAFGEYMEIYALLDGPVTILLT
jgi:D-aminoacyl-tRNA deacylase